MRASFTTAVSVAACALVAALAPAARAAISPSIALDQSAGHAAGATADLGVNLKFAPTGTDSPRNLTLDLPPGLLANASIDGGACLRAVDLSGSACEVGSGTVRATAVPGGLISVPIPVSVPVTFHLVPPPAAGDLAGLAVEGLGEQLGPTGAITIRPTGSPEGVGIEISLSLPDELPLDLPAVGHVSLARISIGQIDGVFDSLRYPATCPPQPADVVATVDSYDDPAVHRIGAPLKVTGCGSLSFSPAFRLTATRDGSDRQVAVTTSVTEASGQAPSGSISLRLPAATLAPNLASIRALCAGAPLTGCPVVGSATATSPLYPRPLTAEAYLTGSPAGLALTLAFPPPFPLTLTGRVDLVANSATFNDLPDIPLSRLGVSLQGGAEGLFASTCRTPEGTAVASLTDVNGDRTVVDRAPFSIAGCPGVGVPGVSGPGRPSAPAGTGGTSRGGRRGPSRARAGHPSLRFGLELDHGRRRFVSLTISLPRGLSFAGRRAGGRTRVLGLSIAGGRVRSAWLSRERLTIVLSRPARAVSVSLRSAALRESERLRTRAASGAVARLVVRVLIRDARARRTIVRVTIDHPHL